MSAPREKKQLSANEPDQEKVLTPEEREAAAKRKTKQYLAIALVVAVLCAALLVWDSGMIQRKSTALTVGDTKYSAAEVSYYYNLVLQDTLTYAQYGMNNYNPNIPAEDQFYYADPANDIIMSWADYFEESAIEQLTTLTAVYDAAIKAGYSEDDVAETVDTQIQGFETSAKAAGYASLKQMLVSYAGRLVTPQIYRDIMTRNALANLYLEEYQSTLDYSDEDLNKYYDEHSDELDTLEYGYIYFRAETVESTDADGNEIAEEVLDVLEDSALNEAYYKASLVAEEWLAIPADQRADAIPSLIEKHSPDISTELKSDVASSISSVLAEWLLDESRTANEIGLVEYPGYGTYAVLFHDRYREDISSVNAQHILIHPELDEGATVPTDAQMAAAKAEAEKVLAEWQAGPATEESFAALAEEYSDDGRNEDGTLTYPGGTYQHVYEGDFVTNFNNWLFHEGAREAGDVGIVENNGDSNYYGYHVLHFLGTNEGDFEWKGTARSTLTSEAIEAHKTDLCSSYTVTEESGMKYVR